MINDLDIITKNEADCIELGRKFSKYLSLGNTVSLEGNLGSGKTTFIKGVMLGFNYQYDVTSPTFTLVNEYLAVKKVVHIDFYREENPERWKIIGIDDYICSNNCITMIEWGNLHPDLLPVDAIFLEFKHVDENKRHIRIRK